MGYTSYFMGSVDVVPPLNESEQSFLKDFAETRRMNRAKGPLFVKGTGAYGQGQDDDILDYNNQHPDQPGLWCQWIPAMDGAQIEWDQGEKFYNAPEWMVYIIDKLLSPRAAAYLTDHVDEDDRLNDFTCNHTLNGVFEVTGEDPDDRWLLKVTDNIVSVQQGSIVYGPDVTLEHS